MVAIVFGNPISDLGTRVRSFYLTLFFATSKCLKHPIIIVFATVLFVT
jgi:hypothetical protein